MELSNNSTLEIDICVGNNNSPEPDFVTTLKSGEKIEINTVCHDKITLTNLKEAETMIKNAWL